MAAHDEILVNYPSGIENQDITDIRDILGGFVSKKASNDTTIGEDRSSVLASSIERQESSTRCKEVGQILVGIADEIDLAHGDSIQDLMGRVGTPNLAFGTFQSVARQLFSWDSIGGQVVKVTWHKIAALLGFCYSLCRQFLLTSDNQRSLMAFFNAVVGYLTRFLFEGRLLNWIRSQGGWMSILQRPVPQVGWMTTIVGIGLSVVGVSLLMYNRLTS